MRKINISGSGLGVRGIRVMMGMRGHAPSNFNRCVGAALRGQRHPAAPPGAGGKENRGWRGQFTAAVQRCRGGAAA
jgi:hypothetical protein